MKFIEIILTLFLSVNVPIIISISVYHQSYISNRTERKSIYENEHYRQKRDIEKHPSYKWKFPIKYYVESPVNETNVKTAIEIISNNTCVNFTKLSYSFNNELGIIFKEGSGCSSYVGPIYKNKPQEIFLTSLCYNRVPYILHELGHALGLVHEHTRSDRNEYVNIELKNVINSEHSNFMILNQTYMKNYSVSYDFSSLMHYHPKDFTTDENKVVISSNTHYPYNRMMGQRVKMTFNDIKQINLRYCNPCNWLDRHGKRNKSYSYIICKNSGYPDYKNCSRCICPIGYTGDNCAKIVSSDKSCGSTKFRARPNVQNLFFDDKRTCYIFLSSRRGTKIDINVTYSNTLFKDICTEEVSNQIKYREDKGNTGLLLCGWYSKYVYLTSESNSVLIIFRGAYKSSGIFLTFKEHKENKEKKEKKGKKKKEQKKEQKDTTKQRPPRSINKN